VLLLCIDGGNVCCGAAGRHTYKQARKSLSVLLEQLLRNIIDKSHDGILFGPARQTLHVFG
jgi:hypothetical protein